MILAIDPGPIESAWVLYDPLTNSILGKRKQINKDCVNTIIAICAAGVMNVVCERIRSYGMAVGAETFETCEWCGRFWQLTMDCGRSWHWVERRQEKLNLCGNPRANDANIRQALIDRFGGKAAIGNKKKPGTLYGITGDQWAALAVAVIFCDLRKAGQ